MSIVYFREPDMAPKIPGKIQASYTNSLENTGWTRRRLTICLVQPSFVCGRLDFSYPIKEEE
jgi:hypothetical protein